MTQDQFQIVLEQRLEMLFTYAQVHALAKRGNFTVKQHEDEHRTDLHDEGGKIALGFSEQPDGFFKLVDRNF